MSLYPLPYLPFSFPDANISSDVDLSGVAPSLKDVFDHLSEDDFAKDAIWRDTFALCGTMRTFYGAASILAAWKATTETNEASSFELQNQPRLMRVGEHSWVHLGFNFKTSKPLGTVCSGFLSVVPRGDGKWKIWIMRTILEGFQSAPNVDALQPVIKASAERTPHRVDSANGHTPTSNGFTDRHPNSYVDGDGHVNGSGNLSGNIYNNGNGQVSGGPHSNIEHYECIVIGGGQAGLAVGGRLKALGISYVVLEKQAEVGDSWRTRYDSTKLHTIRDFAQLPFERTFGKRYAEFLTKDDLARGYRAWATKFGINVSTSTDVVSGTWNSENQLWEVEATRNGVRVSMTSANVVFATGAGSQLPKVPLYEDKEIFRGTALHSGCYRSAAEWTGKHCVVVGTANTAHDVAEDMVDAGVASVTMVQRSETYVVPAEHYREVHDAVYNGLMPIEAADRAFFTGPAVLSRQLSMLTLHAKAAKEPERFNSLEAAGFKLDRDGDMMKYLFQRFGGHYMDVGASDKISKGLIKIRSDSLPVRYLPHGLELANGDELKADVIVFATGFEGNLRVHVAEIFGTKVASQLSDVWGLDEEGELKGAFKPCGHPGFFFAGGAVGQTRYYSRFIALQIKAKLLGNPLAVYSDAPHAPFARG